MAQTEVVKRRWVSIFYNLLRDLVHPADLEKILQDDERLLWNHEYDPESKSIRDAEVVFSNPYLVEYAEDIVGRVFGDRESKVKKAISKPRKV